MSKSEPVDPMPFAKARKELWERLAAKDGFDSEGNVTASADPEKWECKGYAAEEYFHENLRDDALINLAGAGVVDELRIWEIDGGNWKRVPHKLIFEIAHHPDRVGYLYVDREEFETAVLTHYPSTPASLADHEPSGTEEAKPKKGRPKGPGYSPKDEQTYQRILKLQRDSGNTRSQFSVVQDCAGDVNGHRYRTDVDRLRKGLPNWLEENGYQWFPSNYNQ